MNQANNNQIVLCVIAGVLLVFSLPLTWMTIQNPTVSFNGSPFGDTAMNFPMSNMLPVSMKVTGLNGHITLGVQLPIWLLVTAAISAIGLVGLNIASVTNIPSVTPVLILGVVTLYLATGIFAALGGNASLGIGYIMAIVGTAGGMFLSLSQMLSAKQTTAASNSNVLED
ncbi:hypothetical protein [Aeoliella mucimassa]|uniref:Uncharacterized protein n=1 Tax=Aeoliella mucimassa TaxID=2527972 RepID=A0A518ALD7_9BACT|nr:hypothetical protein [Aeoliella mucimassa]QDU55550.1 hypothetical protein Pan181_17420 [Aeoliella mucimassa]